jgi:hypothetical protein
VWKPIFVLPGCGIEGGVSSGHPHGPSQVWSWDITALKGPVKGVWFKCYVIIDIYSRYVTGWLVAAAEYAIVARDFPAGAVTRNSIEPHTIHADRGGAMTSKPVSEMLVDLGVLRSHFRPRRCCVARSADAGDRPRLASDRSASSVSAVATRNAGLASTANS